MVKAIKFQEHGLFFTPKEESYITEWIDRHDAHTRVHLATLWGLINNYYAYLQSEPEDSTNVEGTDSTRNLDSRTPSDLPVRDEATHPVIVYVILTIEDDHVTVDGIHAFASVADMFTEVTEVYELFNGLVIPVPVLSWAEAQAYADQIAENV